MGTLKNSKHELFAQEVAKGRSCSEAYVAAGFNAHGSNAARLSQNESVRARVEELLGAAAEKAGVTISWVVEGLVENYNRAMQAVEIKRPDGTTTGEYKYDGSVANKSLELLGKHLGMFKEPDMHASITVNLSSGDADL